MGPLITPPGPRRLVARGPDLLGFATWASKLLAVGIGALVAAVGWVFWRSGSGLIEGLNYDYRDYHERFRLPLFQYPAEYDKLFGGLLMGFGILLALVGLILAH